MKTVLISQDNPQISNFSEIGAHPNNLNLNLLDNIRDINNPGNWNGIANDDNFRRRYNKFVNNLNAITIGTSGGIEDLFMKLVYISFSDLLIDERNVWYYEHIQDQNNCANLLINIITQDDNHNVKFVMSDPGTGTKVFRDCAHLYDVKCPNDGPNQRKKLT